MRYCLSSAKEDDGLCQLEETEVKLREPEILYEKDEYNHMKLLYTEIRRKWKLFYVDNTHNSNKHHTKLCHSKNFGYQPDNIEKLLQFSSNRYPAKEHFFKILHIRKQTDASPMSTAYSSFPQFSKICLTTKY